MATILETVYKIKERVSSFNITDDNKLDNELIISFMNDIRSSLIREQLNSEGFLANDYYQMNCCYEIECVEGACTYNGVSVSDGKSSYQVKLKPHVKGLSGAEIKYIGDRLGYLPFTKMTFNEFISIEGRVWTGGTRAATILSTDLYLKNIPIGMKFICLLEVLEDPRGACNWIEDTSEYPVPSDTKLVDMVAYRLMNSLRMPDDKLNNATDDTSSPKIADSVIAAQQRLQTEFSNRPQSINNQKANDGQG